MTPTRKREHWKTQPRDSRGRWVKRKSGSQANSKQKQLPQGKKRRAKKSAAAKKTIKTKKKRTTRIQQENISSTLDKIKEDFGKQCPRCSGDMKFYRIRCGPDKIVLVKKCEICNFWLPLE